MVSTTTITTAAGYDVDQFLVTIRAVQEPTEDFTYSGTITLDAALSGDRVVVRF